MEHFATGPGCKGGSVSHAAAENLDGLQCRVLA
jgi:hypothetical protein